MRTKFLLISDSHITSKQPSNRLDDYQAAQYNKFKFILNYANEHEVDAMLFAGDVFDTVFVTQETIKKYIELFNHYKDPHCLVAAVFGQHDLRYHSLNKIDDTPLAVLLAGINGVRLNKDPLILNNHVALYGLSWGEKFPHPEDADLFNVLVAHITVINEEKLFPGQNDFYAARRLLANTKFDMLVTGDNHQRFITEYKGRYLFNNGSVMRSNMLQIDFKPSVTYVEVTDKTINYELVYLPIEKNVFKVETKINSDPDSRVVKFLSSVSSTNKQTKQIDFLALLHKSLEGVDDKDVEFWVEKIIEQYSEQASKSS